MGSGHAVEGRWPMHNVQLSFWLPALYSIKHRRSSVWRFSTRYCNKRDGVQLNSETVCGRAKSQSHGGGRVAGRVSWPKSLRLALILCPKACDNPIASFEIVSAGIFTRHSRARVTGADPPAFWCVEAREPQVKLCLLSCLHYKYMYISAYGDSSLPKL